MKTRIFILVHGGCVTDVYSDSKDVEVEVIDTDNNYTYEEHLAAVARADEVQATYAKID